MKKIILVFFIIMVAMAFGASSSLATQPASKATAKCSDIGIVVASDQGDDQGWQEILTQEIKTPTGKDLFINVSLECGLTTNTKVMSKQLAKSLAMAEAIVKVKVLVDEVPVKVNENGDSEIIFARRAQTLIAEFAGLYNLWSEDCVLIETAIVDEVEVVTGISFSTDSDCFVPESLQLILDTMQANSFNFIHPDLTAGVHTVTVMAKLEYDTDTQIEEPTRFPVPVDEFVLEDLLNEAVATAYLGNGSVTVELVRMIKDEDIIDPVVLE